MVSVEIMVKGDARKILDMAKRLAPYVNKNTYIVGVDASGRLATHATVDALKAQGANVPKTQHFFNFSSHDQIAVELRDRMGAIRKRRHFWITPQNPKKNFRYLKEYIRHMRIPRDTTNILVIDHEAFTGNTLNILKKAFEQATGKKVHTVTIAGSAKYADFHAGAYSGYPKTPVLSLPKIILRLRGGAMLEKGMSHRADFAERQKYAKTRHDLLDAIRKAAKEHRRR